MNSDKWFLDYIDGIDINKIEYLNVNDDEIKYFYNDNGYDIYNGNFVLSDSGDFGWIAPWGMHYLQFDKMPGMKYIIGICKNNYNNKTIISALAYVDDYKIFSNQDKFITYFSTVETNIHFRGLGLFKDLVKNSYNFINHEQNILISSESVMGKRCNVSYNIINIYKSLGFDMDIRSDTDKFDLDDYYNFLKNTGYIKVKRR